MFCATPIPKNRNVVFITALFTTNPECLQRIQEKKKMGNKSRKKNKDDNRNTHRILKKRFDSFNSHCE